ncbi:hypothetical protein GXW74_25715 [Roseomonas eburnea]|uniref:Signal transduction histidine kinase dimerisation/phosphoacceptor domain-containing protein n=1 Tax=Neoroseomonas eburnea TaxID=1346889 RepID=A0A9X9XJL0_9PROT|nr:hypothetical protein [Neoroseomonas eburnea]MBR0683896.1 hypothetical protein [Neoroseomonas eburnea]
MTDDLLAFARPVRHEANNLIAVLSGTADILLRVAATDRDRARASRVREATDQLDRLLKAYLSLVAPSPEEGGTDGPRLLMRLHPLIVLLLGPGRVVEIEVSPRLSRIGMPVVELQTAVLRLAREAAAAVPPGGGLRVVLEPAPGGATLRVAPTPSGKTPPPVFLPAAP